MLLTKKPALVNKQAMNLDSPKYQHKFNFANVNTVGLTHFVQRWIISSLIQEQQFRAGKRNGNEETGYQFRK